MEGTDKRGGIRRFAGRGVLAVLLAIGVLVAAVGIGFGRDDNNASASGTTSGTAQPNLS